MEERGIEKEEVEFVIAEQKETIQVKFERLAAFIL